MAPKDGPRTLRRVPRIIDDLAWLLAEVEDDLAQAADGRRRASYFAGRDAIKAHEYARRAERLERQADERLREIGTGLRDLRVLTRRREQREGLVLVALPGGRDPDPAAPAQVAA
jgi:hypothetical protein